MASWPRPARYPAFDVWLPGAGPELVYLRVRHGEPIGFSLADGPASQMDAAAFRDALWLGAALGALLVLAVWCGIQGLAHRDAAYGWYGLYALVMFLTVATVTGLAGLLLWNRSPAWADAAQGALPIALAGIHLLFVEHLCAVAARHPRLARAATALGAAVLAAAAAYAFLPEGPRRWLVGSTLLASHGLTMAMALLAWRRGDRVGRLVLLAYLPLAAVMAVALLRLFGWLPAGWSTLDSAALGAALAVPLLLLALNARSRYRHGVLDRVNHASLEDALTGVLSADAFERQLKSTVSGALMRKEAAAVVLVDVANLQRIRDYHGDARAEQCLLRTVIQLNRVLRESDPVGRVAPARFGIVIEGARSREEVMERMVRLVAAGLAPVRGDADPVPLHFRIACAMLPEMLTKPPQLLRSLAELVGSMPERSRRPVRFLEPQRATAGEAREPESAEA